MRQPPGPPTRIMPTLSNPSEIAREALRQEVADTLAEGENVDEEIRYLLRACV